MEFIALLFGSWVFLSFFSLFVLCVLIACVESEAPGWATIFIIALTFGLEMFTPLKPLTLSLQNPLNAVALIIGYFGIGTFWAGIKWWRYVVNIKDKVKRYANDYSNWNQTSYSPQTFKQYLSHRDVPVQDLEDKTYKPLILNNKRRFLIWLVYWPFSMIWTVINDPIRKLLNWIYDSLSGFLQSISDKVFADVVIPQDSTEKKKADDIGKPWGHNDKEPNDGWR